MLRLISVVTLLFFSFISYSQSTYWQQSVGYKMEIDFDVDKNTYHGHQQLTYTNNSPDGLDKVFFHLFFNAFQPESMMDVRNRTINDPDRRIKDRIYKLKKEEIGYQKIMSLSQDGKPVKYEVVGTILEVQLAHIIKPGETSVFEMDYDCQVPVQIRRSGRDNAEGIRYSMTQWYPKMCEYDEQGWHAYPYIGREFHGVWGDFDVTISIDEKYVIGGTGLLQNSDEIGHGYSNTKPEKSTNGKLKWHFVANDVHDFAWAADPDYKHMTYKCNDDLTLHFFYQEEEKTEHWKKLPQVMCKVMEYASKHYGKYPYSSYSFIQGGDGGMEYPMATLITGKRSFGSLVGVSVHELMHSWYQGALATNEALYPWMDEGFTSFASTEIMNYLKAEGVFGDVKAEINPFIHTCEQHIEFTKSGYEEPLITHADHFTSNRAYGMGSYVKGQLFLYQIGYLIGDELMHEGLLKYFDDWKFKHPNPMRFLRVMEKISGLELDWYLQNWVNTTNTIDYGIDTVTCKNIFSKTTNIELSNHGSMPMPVDVSVTLKDGSVTIYNIPLRIMRGHKEKEQGNHNYIILKDWPWTNPTYSFQIPVKYKKIAKIEIDASMRILDVDRANNVFPINLKSRL